ncbi:MAG: hypothetical protein WC444_05140 [Candidatus Paceibacterota bacterium]
MSNAQALSGLILQALYSGKLKHGFGDSEDRRIVNHPRVIYGLSSSDPEIPYVIPNEAFTPRFCVSFDFTHTFTTAGIGFKRPVSEDTLYRVGSDLSRFFRYYFEYVLSYGKSNKKSAESRLVDWSIGVYEDDLNLFVNWMINLFISSVTTNSAIHQIGSAVIEINDNNTYKYNNRNRLFYDTSFSILSQLFVPMVPVMIWAKGRLYPNYWFPIFDGFITAPNIATRGGFQSITLNCKDSLEIARISTEMVNPSILQIEEVKTQQSINIFNMPFYGLDHFDIFLTMFHGGKLVYHAEKNRLVPSDPEFHNTSATNFSALLGFNRIDDYQSRLKPHEIAQTKYAIHRDDFSLKKAIKQTSYTERKRNTVMWGNKITPYRILNYAAPKVYEAEFSSRLEVMQNVAQMTYYDLYVNGYGDVCYHPMRLSNEFLRNEAIYKSGDQNAEEFKQAFPGVNIIGPHECTSTNELLNIDELTTFLRLTGKHPFFSSEVAETLLLTGSAVDENLWNRFGYRRKSLTNPLFNINVELFTKNGKKVRFMDMAARILMSFMNAELHTLSYSMIFRPEMRLAFPVLNPYTSDVFYCQSLSHNITVNGEATTTINGGYARKERESPSDLFSFLVMSQRLFDLNGKLPVPPASFNAESVKEYYESNFGISSMQFISWLDEMVNQQEKFEEYERQKSRERSVDVNAQEVIA